MYRVDDFLDLIATRSLQKKAMSGNKVTKEVRLFFSNSNHLAFSVSIAHKIKKLRGRLDALAKDINGFNFIRFESEALGPISVRSKEPSHSYIPADSVIGRDKEKEDIVNMLLADVDDGECVSVITIVGIGGLGKTALAQLVYNDQKVQDHFDLRQWACVNDLSDLKIVLQKILSCGTDDVDNLQQMLRQKFNQKKVLLVLDDIWDYVRENWLRVQELLDGCEKGSQILVTTRLEPVARNLGSTKDPYNLQGLSDKDAWSLFQKMAFDTDQLTEIDQELETLGRKILEKCANVPLAIRTIGSFLYRKDKKQWESFAERQEILRGIPDRENKIMQVLKISYNDLPLSLKKCFAYCSLFPKDYVFVKTELIHLWMAQGFLESSNRKQSLEDVGEDYFCFLLERCFFQDVVTNENRALVWCKMHDLLHDLAMEVAAKDCIMVKSLADDLSGTHRHVSYNCEEIPLSFHQMEGIRTLLFHNSQAVKAAMLDRQILQLRSLRVLDLSDLEIKELPSSIGRLLHLRYLDLSQNHKLIKLPSSLCKLQNLLTLKLDYCSRLRELPSDFKLLCLRHLELRGCSGLICMPPGLKEMTCLVTLSKLMVNKKSGGLRYLKNLNDLRGKLTIELPGDGWKNCVVDAKESSLSSKRELSRLEIVWTDSTEGPEVFESDAVLDQLQPQPNLRFLEVANFPGRGISRWFSSLDNLLELKISSCHRCEELPSFEHLNNLKRLYLVDVPLVEHMEDDVCYDVGLFFESLETLCISRMPKLKRWWRQVGESIGVDPQNSTAGQVIRDQFQPYSLLPWFPQLSTVDVLNCPDLTDLPLFPYVEELKLAAVNEKLLRNSVLRAPPALAGSTGLSSSSAAANPNWCRLKTLRISLVEELICPPDEWANHLSTLCDLSISECPNLKSLSKQWLQHLTALGKLEITGFRGFIWLSEEDLQEEDDGMPWLVLEGLKSLKFDLNRSHLLKGLHHLTALEDLDIHCGNMSNEEDVPLIMPWKPPPNIKRFSILGLKKNKLTLFREAFYQLTKLEDLSFWYCREVDEHELDTIPWESLKALRSLNFGRMSKMKALPVRCQNLPNLQQLSVRNCDEVESLPDWITRLKGLSIGHCGLVSEKYRKPTGPCWPQILHIPRVRVV